MARYRMSTVGRRARLRLETADAHRLLDELSDGSGMTSTLDGYRVYLAATFVARSLIESRLTENGVAALYSVWPQRLVSHAIEEDLRDLSIPVPVPLASAGTSPLSIGAMLGTLYVLEGSALGAKVIAQRLERLGITAKFGARHLARQTEDVRAWPDFIRLLEETPLTDREERDCMREAVATFDAFACQFVPAV
jgi:heme oxygenase